MKFKLITILIIIIIILGILIKTPFISLLIENKNILIITLFVFSFLPIVPEKIVNPFLFQLNTNSGIPSKNYSLLYLLLTQIYELINQFLFFSSNIFTSLINSIKFLSWLIFVIIIFISLFRVFEANLSNNILVAMAMILLMSLFNDLTEFNFLGIKGKRLTNIENLEGKQALSQAENPLPRQVQEAEKQPLQLMDNDRGNFLALSFEIERLLRVISSLLLGQETPLTTGQFQLTKDLRDRNFLTDSGVEQLEAIRKIRNLLVHGREQEVNLETLQAVTQVAFNLYQELFNWLYKKENK